MRFGFYILMILLTIVTIVLTVTISLWWLFGALSFGSLALLGTYDLIQPHHSILRNYPILAHCRFLLEGIAPEIHQYFVESNLDGRPFDRDARSLVYRRAKNIEGLKPFGTELDVYKDEYEWAKHSMAPHPKAKEHFRTTVGGPDCTQPYSCAIYNISAMSFGAISPNAIMAMNRGAKKGNFYHTTGEGGMSKYHLKFGGDLVWQIGTGYFGCRNSDGTFNADLFAEQAVYPQVKMVEIKISQGAKPGHGGVLPAAKITPEIAKTRKVPMGQDCISPPGHTAFSTPIEMCEYIQELRKLSGGKPIGFKICIGRLFEFMAVCKAMIDTGIMPDFITVDGGEGGTGAAPQEFSNSLGTPLVEGLIFVHNALVGANLRKHIKIACAGKATSAAHIVHNLALGADWCNAARGFMMAVGCIQAQTCHTNECPVGVATQDPVRQRALNVTEKWERVYNFQHNTMAALVEVIAAMGLDHPTDLKPKHIVKRVARNRVASYNEAYHFLEAGELLAGSEHPLYADAWDLASPDTFQIKQQRSKSKTSKSASKRSRAAK
jgi:glutamate synthase domain-containing protein 2